MAVSWFRELTLLHGWRNDIPNIVLGLYAEDGAQALRSFLSLMGETFVFFIGWLFGVADQVDSRGFSGGRDGPQEAEGQDH